MNWKMLLPVLLLALVIAFAMASPAAADGPKGLTANFSKNGTECSMDWFNADMSEIVPIYGEGRIIEKPSGGYVMTCKFFLDFTNPDLLSREDFCAQDWAAFMCKGNGGLVDNRTTCNIAGDVVHNGTIVAGPSGEGTFVCNVK